MPRLRPGARPGPDASDTPAPLESDQLSALPGRHSGAPRPWRSGSGRRRYRGCGERAEERSFRQSARIFPDREERVIAPPELRLDAASSESCPLTLSTAPEARRPPLLPAPACLPACLPGLPLPRSRATPAGFKEIAPMPVKDVKKVVLAYSGGLDTSVILRWLQTTYHCEVVTFTADLGQGEELGPARKKAEMFGVKEIFVDDLRETFVRDFVFPMFRANTVYEGQYLLGTSIARPLIAQRQIEIAEQVGADAVAHGATGKGNDQVRFELSYYALKPDIKIIAPWREWDLTSRTRLLEFAEQNQIPIAKDKRGEAPFSVDANLLHSSSEGK